MILPNFPTVSELTRDQTGLPDAVDVHGWNSDHPYFAKLIAEVNPALIIEVGTWKGRSAINMAELSKGRMGMCEVSGASVPMPPPIVCVDTWLGGIDHYLSKQPIDDRRLDAHGSPRLYELFLKNVAGTPHAGRIHPLRQTSNNAAKILAHQKIVADLIYIDGSHEYDDVYADLCAYVPLLSESGRIFGDDFRSFPGVFAAVVRFAHENGYGLHVEANNFWSLT